MNYLIVILSFKSAPFSHLLNSHDSSMFMYFGSGMKSGLVPYNDMFDHKGIILFLIQELGAFLGGNNVSTGIWILELIFYSITLVFIFKIAYSLTGNTTATGFSIFIYTGLILSTLTNGNFSEEFALLFIVVALDLFIKEMYATSHFRLFFIGATGGLVFFMRANLVSLWLVFCLYFLFQDLLEKSYQRLANRIGWIFLGGLTICLAVVLYGLSEHNLHSMFYQTFILNSQYSSATNIRTIAITARQFCALFLRTGLAVPILLLVICFELQKKKLDQRTTTLIHLFFGYLIIDFLTVVMSGRYYPHYFITMLPILIIMTAIGFSLFKELIPQRRINFIMYFGVLLLSLTGTMTSFKEFVKPVVFDQNKSEFQALQKKQAKYIQVHSTKNSSIYVHNIDANIYLLSERFSNSKYFVLPSIDYRNFPSISLDFQKAMDDNPPKFISILKSNYDETNPDNSKLNSKQ